MNLLSLQSSEALGPGADFWFLAPTTVSRWAQRLDWYCRFLISKAEHRKSWQVDPVLLQKCEAWDVSVPEIWVHEQAPVMIPSSVHLPTKALVVLDCQAPALWCQKAIQIAKRNQISKFRLFSSDHISDSKWLEALSQTVNNSDVSTANESAVDALQVQWVSQFK